MLGAALERDALQREVVETRALRRSDVLKTALLRAVSHDLRSPLTAILAAAEALGSTSLRADERGELVADIVGEAAQRLSRLVDNLLDLSRLEAAHAPSRASSGARSRRSCCAAVDDVALPPGTFALAIDPDLPLIRADAAQLERAFANLLENAARYSGGHPVSVRARAVGARILVRVVDRGPGIPPAEQRARSSSRSTARPAIADGHRGSGLGLAIVEGFVEANGGRVWVESLPGQGTTFVVELPVASDDAEALTRVSDRRRVLVCDDEPQILRALKVILREAGYEAIAADAPCEEALDRAAVRPPDAAIIDLDAARRQRRRGLPAAARVDVDADPRARRRSARRTRRSRALEAGADDYVTKPFGPRELVARLEAALRRAGDAPGEPAIERRRAATSTSPPASCAATARRSTSRRSSSTCCARSLRNRGRLHDPPRAAGRGLGPAVRATTRRSCAPTSPTCGARSSRPASARYIRTDAGVGYRFAG